jgi:predicted amidohydrolase
LSEQRVKIAVVQPKLAVGDVSGNLRRLEQLATAAGREHDPDLLLLPEAMTSPNMFGPVMLRVPRPVDGEPLRMLQRMARELDCTVGGGFLSVRSGEARHTYVVAEPDGTLHLHDKDQPSMWENNYYTGGRDDGLFTTGLGTVGCVMGFEWGRSRTARRLRGKVELVLGGSCWWSAPLNWRFLGPINAREHHYNICMAREVVPRMARMVGAPCAIAQHVGEVDSRTPLLPGLPYKTIMVGHSQVVERDGRVLARLGYEDGEGYIAGEVELAPPRPLDPIPSGFWHHPMSSVVQFLWYYQNLHGRLMYPLNRRRSRWSREPPRDLPNYVAAEVDGTTSQAEEVPA